MSHCWQRPRRLEVAAIVALLLGALLLRAYHLGIPTLTGDEWFMLRNHDEGPAWIVRQARVFEPHPLLYYLGLWGWIELVGRTEWAMRLPSVYFGLVVCIATWRAAREVAGWGAGLIAAALVAVNPYQIAQSQNARNYAMVAALATLATSALLAADRRGGSTWRRYAVTLLLALHTHLNAVLTAVAHALWLITHRALRGRSARGAAGGPIGVGIAVLILFVPWLAYAWPALTAYQGFYPERVGVAEVVVRTFATFAFGQQESARRLWIGAAGGLALVGVAWSTWRSWRHRDDRPLALVGAAGAPVLGTAALFLLRPMFEERYLIVAAPACLAVIGLGIAWFSRFHWAVSLGALATLVAMTAPFVQRYYPAVAAARPDWRGLAGWIAEHERPGDVVLVTGQGVADAYGYYRRAAAPTVLAAQDATASRDVDALLSQRPRGAFLLPYWESPADRAGHDALVARGFADQVRWFAGQRTQYVGLPDAADPPPHAVGARWLEAIQLTDAAVAPARVAPGDAVRVLARWRGLRPAPDLKISLRLTRGNGESVAQLDRRPVDESRPFPTMAPGEDVRDGHLLWTPPDLAPGTYGVALLLYRPEGAAAVRPDGAENDLVQIGRVDVGP